MAINREVRVDFVGKDRTQAAARSAVDGVKRVQKELTTLSAKAASAQRVFNTLTLGFAGAGAIRTLSAVQNSLLQLRNLSTDYAKDQQFLSKTTKALNLDLQEAAKAYADIIVLQNTGFLSGDQAQSLFIGFQETAKKFAVSSTDVQFALRGLRQALTAGVVRAQEFDQIFDAIGPVANGVAKNLGITTQELLKLRSSATLSSQELLNALIPALREADGTAASAAQNIDSSLKKLSTAFKEGLLAFEDPISGGVAAFSDATIAAIDAMVEHSGKIQTVGIAIASAFAGKGLTAVGQFANKQRESVAASVAHSKALAINNAKLLESAKGAQSLASFQKQLVSTTLATLQAEEKTVTTQKKKLALQKSILLAKEREKAADIALATAKGRVTSANVALTASQRAATTSSIALAGATSALKGAMALVGGPIGIAAGAIALLVLKAREGSKEIRELKKANEELDDRVSVVGGRAFSDIASAREEAEIKLNELYKERAGLIKEEANNNNNHPLVRGEYEAKIKSLNAKITELKDNLDSIELKETSFQYATAMADEIDAINNAAKRLGQTVDNTPALIEKFLPDRAKIEELKKALKEARASFEPDSSDGKAVIAAIQGEIDKLSGATKAREEYNKKIKEGKRDLEQLKESLRTERERIEATFASAQATIAINVEMGTVDSSQASTIIAKAREKMDSELAALDEADLKRSEEIVAEKKRLRDQEIADLHAYRDRLIEAKTIVDPESGELERFRTEIMDLNRERGKSIALDKDYYLLVEAARLEHNERMNQIAEEQAGKQQELFAKLSNYDKIATAGGIASDFVSAFEKNVGSYITLTEDMTDAEKKQAIASNAINKKRFEDNKKASIAQAIISTITGATRAFETVPYPANFVAAAAIAAAGFRNVANIRSAQFGSGASSVSTGGATSSTSTSTSTEAVTAEPEQQSNITVHVYPPIGASQDEIDRQVAASIQRSVERDEIVPETTIIFNNAA